MSEMVERVTMRKICETIERSGILQRPDGTHPTAREIFEYSPTGELFMIHEWYAAALAIEAALKDPMSRQTDD